jgi:N-acetylmuramoyl-L-alanine amidase
MAPLREANPGVSHPLRDVRLSVPWAVLAGSYRVEAIRALFPRDRRIPAGWEHVILAPWGGDGESWWEMAEWWCGDGRLYRDLRAANPQVALFPAAGDRVLIPSKLLLPEFRRLAPEAPGPTAPARRPPTPTTPPGAGPPAATPQPSPAPAAPVPTPVMPAASGGPLEYLENEAVYRLRPGEALYSAVVVRFTGQLHAPDVNATAAELAKRSHITDVTNIPIGYPIRIPFDLLLPEYLPPGNPRRVEWVRGQEELAAIKREIRAANLDGIHIILDAGHGGEDTGAIVDGVWESTYVYDVMERVKRVLQQETGATVWTTVQELHRRTDWAQRNVLPELHSERLLVDPPYDLSDSVTGVHLRWVLADAILKRLVRQKVSPERVAFVSIHADSLHPSVRGLMVYVPDRNLRPLRGPLPPRDHTCREVREVGRPRFSRHFLARSEALSQQLASSVVSAARRYGIPVHEFEPVRSSIVRRRGSPWVPAVLRYSEVPSALLVEICNLNNDQDRRELLTWRFREKLAHAIAAGLAEGFSR